MTTRYALYYAPATDDPLWSAGCAWLGRDPTGGAAGRPPEIDGIAAMTAEARGYGFHATLKPPMRLRDGVTRDDLVAAVRTVAAGVAPFALPPLRVCDYHGFLCLRETLESTALQALSDVAVAGVDSLRASPDEAELARRRGRGLSPVRDANLVRWGYPDVFGAWFFHMTISRRLVAAETAVLRPLAEAWFAAALAGPRDVRDISLFEQDGETAFRLTARIKLGGDTT